MERVHVAVGVICKDQRILLSRRRQGVHLGGLWEFPGGKVETDETVSTALHRELEEELGILIQRCEPLLQVRHDYADRPVLLDVCWVQQFTGELVARESQPLMWATPRQLAELDLPAANRPIVDAVLARLGRKLGA